MFDRRAERAEHFKITAYVHISTFEKFFINAGFGNPFSFSPLFFFGKRCCPMSYSHPFQSSLISLSLTKKLYSELNIYETVILHLIFRLATRFDSSSGVNFVLLPPIILFLYKIVSETQAIVIQSY